MTSIGNEHEILIVTSASNKNQMSYSSHIFILENNYYFFQIKKKNKYIYLHLFIFSHRVQTYYSTKKIKY